MKAARAGESEIVRWTQTGSLPDTAPHSNLAAVAITQLEARQQIIGDLAVAIDQVALAVACLGEAYEQLPDDKADQLEAELFRPVQKAFGRARRAKDGFAQRYGLSGPPPEGLSPGLASQGVKSFVEQAVEAAGVADMTIAELQDSMLPIESGDPELRQGLAEVRDLLAGLPLAAREFLRTLGR